MRPTHGGIVLIAVKKVTDGSSVGNCSKNPYDEQRSVWNIRINH